MYIKYIYKFYSNIKLKWYIDIVYIVLILENNDYLIDKILMVVFWGLIVLL